jgi:MFS family permease
MRRDRALVTGYAIQAAANGACAVALWTAPPAVVYVFAVIAACAITLTRPVHHALLPELAETPDELTAANSISSSVEGLGMLVGPILAAVILAAGGAGAVLAAFAVTSALGAFAASRLRLVQVTIRDLDADVAPRAALVRDAVDGLRALRREPGGPSLALLGASQFFVLGALDVFYALLAIDILGSGEQAAGLLASAVGVGGLVGAAATAALVGRRRLAGPILVGLAVTGSALAAVAGATGMAVALVLLAACGAGRTFFDVAARTLLQRTVRDDVLARVFGLQEGLIMVVTALGSAAVPLLVLAIGERWAFVVAGAVLPVFGVVLLGKLRAADARADVPDPARVALLSNIDIFAPLAQPVLERLARELRPRHVAAGEAVIVEGELGDRFYVLVEGDAVVSRGGHEVARVGPGAYVGEIALLRDVPRTASVVATSPLALLSLERGEFLAAVAGHRPSTKVADEEVARRLARLGDVGTI